MRLGAVWLLFMLLLCLLLKRCIRTGGKNWVGMAKLEDGTGYISWRGLTLFYTIIKTYWVCERRNFGMLYDFMSVLGLKYWSTYRSISHLL